MRDFNFTQIKETCLYVSNLKVTSDFYHGKLGLEIITRVEDQHIFFRVGTSVLLCFLPQDSKKKSVPPGHFAYGKQHIAFEVHESDYIRYLNLIRDSGIKIIHRQKWGDRFESFYFEDPDGHILEIVPEGMWE